MTTSVSLEQGGPDVHQNLGCHKFYMKFEIRIIVGMDGLLTSINFLRFLWSLFSLSASNISFKVLMLSPMLMPLLPRIRSIWGLLYAPLQRLHTEFLIYMFFGVDCTIDNISRPFRITEKLKYPYNIQMVMIMYIALNSNSQQGSSGSDKLVPFEVFIDNT